MTEFFRNQIKGPRETTKSSVRTASFWADILTQDVRNMKPNRLLDLVGGIIQVYVCVTGNSAQLCCS